MRRIGLLAALCAGSLLLPGCAKKEETAVAGQLKGKVTYKGKPVPLGYVIFVSLDNPIDPATDTVMPAAVSPIDERGGYEVESLPEGPMLVFVATDPDADLSAVLAQAPGLPREGAPPDHPEKEEPPPPPDRDGVPVPAPGENPFAETLSEQEKQVLREIHAKYGNFVKPALDYVVHDGAQTFDIVLD